MGCYKIVKCSSDPQRHDCSRKEHKLEHSHRRATRHLCLGRAWVRYAPLPPAPLKISRARVWLGWAAALPTSVLAPPLRRPNDQVGSLVLIEVTWSSSASTPWQGNAVSSSESCLKSHQCMDKPHHYITKNYHCHRLYTKASAPSWSLIARAIRIANTDLCMKKKGKKKTASEVDKKICFFLAVAHPSEHEFLRNCACTHHATA